MANANIDSPIQAMHEALCAKYQATGFDPENIRFHVAGKCVGGKPFSYVAWWDNVSAARFPDVIGYGVTMQDAAEDAFAKTMAAL